MKVQFLITFTAYLLILTSATDENCTFTIDQLNNKVLKTVLVKDCNNCFTSDVTLTIQSNSQQITSLKLTAVESSSPVQSVTLQPATKSLTINTNFSIDYPTPGGFSFSNLIISCNTKLISGKLYYDLTFQPKVNGQFQIFTLNNGITSSLLVKSVAYISMIICIVLFF
ncbi:transmembrane protein, putative (macronuclear) [Tetrahymena thermophila SB210]|uniref:Transmembrane protein, putative n=1 Tax=Tetrahymena thermophila (strain SB210) TaxID=312017 RepID=Q23E15_TETTS|nr:transmembrane protein, putative [Tetrahymena thermophila SB210]EAR94772.1 transmembrane protein, putative [Tetrahymena thermophila SB210]|eukprot:XP_001015017.1 transmembrane protein, putative [Tetrahymena thermophila SB210]